ncbi:DUF2599 domain-containing protein [Streptomyces sp. RFCAC02]|uniref:DUF2599 domain-containing protein n=1 Tax=Streptomyces sp. RFCAC02 TaxID=2499143 RepID=UPI00143DC0B3|nr:DUF2599 domain-containing protein [Streptomyces sp. RFCAC02]
MTPTPLLRRPAALFRGAAVVLAAVLAVLTVQAVPAAAEEICGQQVGGEILVKYDQMGRQTSPLGCPTSGELVTPDGRGRYNTFEHGSIYWTPTTGAHPVWGAILDKWGSLGWEQGDLGYPVDDELTNPDGLGKRQEFEGGTVYWHPTLSNGAHPVWGEIGRLWGEYGWESGPFGYPTSDEGWDEDYKSIYQTFSSNNSTLFWSAGNGVEGCTGECVGYSGTAGTDWFTETRVEIPVGSGDVVVRAYPTESGFINGRTDFVGAWNQIWSMAPYPNGVSETEHRSMYEQFACHAAFSDQIFPGEWNTQDSWDLESWRADIGMEDALDPILFLGHWCNWD